MIFFYFNKKGFIIEFHSNIVKNPNMEKREGKRQGKLHSEIGKQRSIFVHWSN